MVKLRFKCFSISFQMLIILLLLEEIMALACYKCQSRNGMDPACESGSSGANYQKNCRFQPIGRQSQFAGNYCVKIVGKLVPGRETIVIRDCDERPLNRNQVGQFNYRGVNINGTQYSCNTDYCNHGSSHSKPGLPFIVSSILLILFSSHHYFKWTADH